MNNIDTSDSTTWIKCIQCTYTICFEKKVPYKIFIMQWWVILGQNGLLESGWIVNSDFSH